jgi:hypothetical protein
MPPARIQGCMHHPAAVIQHHYSRDILVITLETCQHASEPPAKFGECKYTQHCRNGATFHFVRQYKPCSSIDAGEALTYK